MTNADPDSLLEDTFIHRPNQYGDKSSIADLIGTDS